LQAPESRLFTFRSEFHLSVLELLARARRTLAFADHDFSDWPLESPQAIAELGRLLREPDARLRLVVHSPEWLERNAARFGQLRRRFADRIECRQAPPRLATGEGLLVGDRIHLLRRAHYQAYRGRLLLAMPESVEPWLRKYEQLWQESAPCLTGTTTGLG
jgi:hypothetical protein